MTCRRLFYELKCMLVGRPAYMCAFCGKAWEVRWGRVTQHHHLACPTKKITVSATFGGIRT